MIIVRNIEEIIKIQYANPDNKLVCINDNKITFYPVSNVMVQEWLSKKKKISPYKAPSIDRARELKINQLVDFYNSENFRRTEIEINNNNYVIINTSKLRNLFLRKILTLENQINNGDILPNEAKFSYVISDFVTEDLSLEDLKKLLILLEDTRQQQFYKKELHKKAISALQTEVEIESYDLNIGW